MAFDFFTAELACPTCGKLASGNAIAVMQTRIQRDPQGKYLKVGDQIDLAPGGPSQNGYLTVKKPQPDAPIHLLEVWSCPFCNTVPNWSEVILENEQIKSITALSLNCEILERIHYITEELIYYYDDITGLRMYNFNEEAPLGEGNTIRPDWIERLCENL